MNKKKKIIIGVVGVTLCIITIVVIYILNSKPILDRPPVVYIDFPREAGLYYTMDVDVEFNDNYEIENKEILEISYTTHNVDFEKIIKKIRKRYDVVNEESEKEENLIIGDDNKKIIKYGDTGLQYVNNNDVNGKMKISDEECIEIAEKELKKLGLLRDGMEYDYITYDKQEDGETIVAKTVHYKRVLDGIEVEGTSYISVTLVGDGDVKAIDYCCGEIYEKCTIPERFIIPLKSAIRECGLFKGQVNIPKECDRVVVEKVECVYWEDSRPGSENKAIQPVYKFIGTAYLNGEECGEFIAFEMAVEEPY